MTVAFGPSPAALNIAPVAFSTAIYARLSVDPVRQAVEKATGAMFSAAGLGPKATVTRLPKRAAK